MSFLCQEEINLAPVNILWGAGRGEGLGRCFLPLMSILYCVATVYRPICPALTGPGWHSRGDLRLKQHQYGLIRPEKIIWLVWTWSEKILWSCCTTEILISQQSWEECESKHCNQTDLHWHRSMMEQNSSFITTDGRLRRLQEYKRFLMFTPFRSDTISH